MVVAQAVATATERQSSRCLSCSGLLAVAIAPFWFYFTCVDALGLGFNVRQPCPPSPALHALTRPPIYPASTGRFYPPAHLPRGHPHTDTGGHDHAQQNASEHV